jgi:hypothetical protein
MLEGNIKKVVLDESSPDFFMQARNIVTKTIR